MRKDLNMRKGKMIAQGSHASLGGILQLMEKTILSDGSRLEIKTTHNTPLHEWLADKFTKICVSVSSEKELLDINEKAKKAGLNSYIIRDAGLTEFGGVPTYTCLAIGPDYADKINEITGHLSLL